MSRAEYSKELAHLQGELLKMGTLVEELIYKAVKSMVQKDQDLAEEVIRTDDVVDDLTLEIEQKCLSLIALQQPMAKDLRMIGTALRIIIDLERIADYAEGLAKITIRLMDQSYMKPLIDIPRMGDIASDMLRKTMKSYVEEDTTLSWSLIEDERIMDGLYNQVFHELLAYMMADPKTINQATSLLLAAGHLERMADHITNVGEMVIYMVEGTRVDLNRLARER
ncbi:MAG: phosphate signaling complex protein PhoU [Syntrophomonadaceae bacterium]|nr:phosphate signaling complex protein PhoU [Syntrophomonadaceae bacterium]